MDITVERLDGTQYLLSDYNISIVDFKIDSPSPRFSWETIESRNGLIDLGTTYGERTLRGAFEFVAEDFDSFPLLRNDIFKIFDSREAFYLIDDREPDKRWLVKANGYSPDQLIVSRGKFSVDFISPTSFAESILTTLESTQAQISGGRIQKYRQTTANFEILNDGDIKADPRLVTLTITYTGASTNLKIKNNTTGEEWDYTGSTAASDAIILDGIRSTKNGLSIFRDTNRKLITLAPGWNEFEITGAIDPFEITFDFRFYYL